MAGIMFRIMFDPIVRALLSWLGSFPVFSLIFPCSFPVIGPPESRGGFGKLLIFKTELKKIDPIAPPKKNYFPCSQGKSRRRREGAGREDRSRTCDLRVQRRSPDGAKRNPGRSGARHPGLRFAPSGLRPRYPVEMLSGESARRARELVRVRCSAHRRPRSERGTLLHELHPGSVKRRTIGASSHGDPGRSRTCMPPDP
jgi:hypothetical protein